MVALSHVTVIAFAEDPPYPPSLRLEMAHLGQYSIKIEPKEGKFDKSTTLRIKLG